MDRPTRIQGMELGKTWIVVAQPRRCGPCIRNMAGFTNIQLGVQYMRQYW